MKDWIKAYFSFTRREQRGIMALLSILMIMIIIYPLVPLIIPANSEEDAFYIESLEAILTDTSPKDSTLQYNDINNDPEVPAARMFHFNPNTLDERGWISLGIGEKLAGTIRNYREKGGKFRKKEDLRKIYGMKEAEYWRLEPWIVIETVSRDRQPVNPASAGFEKERKNPSRAKAAQDTLIIELNGADTADLMKLNGIGRYYTGKIIRYRERLGGFVRTEQLLEIEGMDSARFSLCRSQCRVDTSLVRKFDLNSTPFKEFLKHPYFEYHVVKAIFQQKDRRGRFRSVGELREIPLFHEEFYSRLAPYLSASEQ